MWQGVPRFQRGALSPTGLRHVVLRASFDSHERSARGTDGEVRIGRITVFSPGGSRYLRRSRPQVGRQRARMWVKARTIFRSRLQLLLCNCNNFRTMADTDNHWTTPWIYCNRTTVFYGTNCVICTCKKLRLECPQLVQNLAKALSVTLLMGDCIRPNSS